MRNVIFLKKILLFIRMSVFNRTEHFQNVHLFAEISVEKLDKIRCTQTSNISYYLRFDNMTGVDWARV